ncbi:HDOD domain-containing protein [Aurantivibrio plasticivorans]
MGIAVQSLNQQYQVYRQVIGQVLKDSEKLPSLPSVTLKIRRAISSENTTIEQLAELISKDAALSTLLLKAASSPIYRRAVTPKTLPEVIGLLGFSSVNSLVMLHSVRSVMVLRSPSVKKLFAQTWRRLVVKMSVAGFLAKQLKSVSVDEAQMASMLTEVGALAVLSALLELDAAPDSDTYVSLCRNYSKSLGSILLQKWNVDQQYIDVAKRCGDWADTDGVSVGLLDVVNLSIYYAVKFTNKSASLPAIGELAVYKKLLPEQRRCKHPDWLDVIFDNKADIQALVESFR